jgi:hypothetical protein
MSPTYCLYIYEALHIIIQIFREKHTNASVIGKHTPETVAMNFGKLNYSADMYKFCGKYLEQNLSFL